MNCRKIELLLVDYAEETLSERAERKVLRHVEHCEKCRANFEQIRQVRQEIRMLQVPELTDESWNAFQERLLHEIAQSAPRPEHRIFWKPALAFAGTAAFAMLLFLVVIMRQAPQTETIAPHLADNIAQPAMEGESESSPATEKNSQLALAEVSGKDLEEFLADAALLSDGELDELTIEANDSLNLIDDIEELSPEECNEALERLESVLVRRPS